jgi:hypothetical protein
MSWYIFLDEPGDHQLSWPYGVLAGLAVEDRFVWQLARELKDAESRFFGPFRADVIRSPRIDTLLDPQVIYLAASQPQMSAHDRQKLIDKSSMELGRKESFQTSVALAQAKLAFCQFVLNILADYHVKAFANIINQSDIVISYETHLRKDYAFLFERASYLIDLVGPGQIGLFLLDSRRHTGKYVSIKSITSYFVKTTKGRLRSHRLIPEPVLAEASLAVVNQAVALFSYIISSSFRMPTMSKPRRFDLDDFVKQCNKMRFSYINEFGVKDWSFIFLEDVRARYEEISPLYKL